MRTSTSLTLAASLGCLLSPRPAPAYEPTTTLAGLTERAALGSQLHRRLAERFHRPLGLFEPLRLRTDLLGDSLAARRLRTQLLSLDPAEGYAPGVDRDARSAAVVDRDARSAAVVDRDARSAAVIDLRQTALGWLAAGSVLEGLPPARIANHFYDPTTDTGLTRPPGQTAPGAAVRAVSVGISTSRELLTGAAFDGTGEGAPDWMVNPKNELGLLAFRRSCEQAVVAERPETRETALVQALLSAGAILALLEQMGDPAHVRNDFDQALLEDGGKYQRWVAMRYGRAGVPSPAPAVDADADARPVAALHLRDLFADSSGDGLAERTAKRFYSAGTLPGTAAQLVRGPALPLDWDRGRSGYIGIKEVPHLVAHRRYQGGTQFLLDERCYADYAAVLLPEIGRYAVRALELLFRGGLVLALEDGGHGLRVSAPDVSDGPGGLGPATLVVLGEGADQRRRVLAQVRTAAVPAQLGGQVTVVPLRDGDLAGVRRLAVLLRGGDQTGEPLLLSAEMALSEDAAP